jgi:hypothetical protein
MARVVIHTEAEAHNAMFASTNVFFECSRCRQIKRAYVDGMMAGYGWINDKPMCYACCAQSDRLEMLATGKVALYLVKNEVTNWPGTLRFKVVARRPMRHAFARAEIAYFTGPDGKQWSAKNIGDSDIAHCRRLKKAVA